jgi:hypothetical protein
MLNIFPARRTLLGALLMAALSPCRADDGVDDLLARVDAIRNPEGSFSLDLMLVEYRAGQLAGKAAITVYAKPAPDRGQYNNLVRYMQPAYDSGKLVLRNGLDLWFYDPKSAASVRISPQARLLGQASNGDVMATRLASDYTGTTLGKDRVEPAAGAAAAIKLRLIANRPDVTYARVDYWIEEGDNRPLKAQYFTAEGRLLKTAFFRRYQQVLGRERPTETVIIDALDPQWVTVMRASSYASREIPQAWLQREYLARFNPGHG